MNAGLGALNGRANLRPLVDGQVIQHDHISRAQRRHQDLFHVGLKRRGVDGPVEHRGRGQALEAQPGNDGVRLPVAARRVVVQACAARAATIASQEVGGDATLIEKNILAHVAQRLRVVPPATRRGDIRTPLLVGVYRFFTVNFRRSSARQIVARLAEVGNASAPDDFIPVREGWEDRSPLIAREGRVSFHHFDLYAQALAKIEPGHEQDTLDVRKLLTRGIVDRAQLRADFDAIEPRLYRYPAIDPAAFRRAVTDAVQLA